MKLKKIFAGVVASAMATTAAAAMMINASAAGTHKAYMVFADNSWFWGSWGYDDTAKGYCANGAVDVTGDGTYTVYIDKTLVNTANLGATGIDDETGDPYTVVASGVQVFCVDIEGLADELGLAKYEGGGMSALDHGNVTISDVKIVATMTQEDGSSEDQTFTIDNDKVTWGNIEGKGNLRIEIANAYGVKDEDDKNLVNDPANYASLSFNDKLAVTFTISGIGGGASDDTQAPDDTDAPATEAPATEAPATAGDSTKPNTNTGVEGVAAVAGVALLAAGAVVVAKKRK